MSKAKGWTPARRKAQSERIHKYRPWEQSTGPRTSGGKAVSSQNADKGKIRPMMRILAKAMRDQRRSLSDIG